jgi:hypothetical protein
MATGHARPILCWDSAQATDSWERSPDNKYWRPKTKFYPDTRQLQAGDIILFKPLKPTLSQRTIQMYEGGTFTHAAIYLQADHEICESDPATNGVAITSLERHLTKNCILVRRVPDLQPEGRDKIAEMAVSLVNTPYGFQSIFESVVERLTGKHFPVRYTKSLKTPIICSALCEHAMLAASKGTIFLTRRTGSLIMPEDLAAANLLQDVDITWKLVRE